VTTAPRLLAFCALSATACGATQRPDPRGPEVVDELPPWLTEGEKVRLEVAQKLVEQGNTHSALEIIRGMRQDGYDSGELDLLQGKALRMDGLVDDAEALLRDADKKLRRDARPATEMCILFADAGRLDEAIAQCRRATELDTESAQAWNNLGFLQLAADLPEEALASCSSAVQLDSSNPLFRNNLALAQAALGRHEAAYQTYQSTLPRSLAAFNVGAALERFDDPQSALVYYERALSYDPSNIDAVAARERLAPANADAPTSLPAPVEGEALERPGDTP